MLVQVHLADEPGAPVGGTNHDDEEWQEYQAFKDWKRARKRGREESTEDRDSNSGV